MEQGHKHEPSGSRHDVYEAEDIPRFKHRAPRTMPRYSSVLALIWCAAFYLTIHFCLLGIHKHALNWHYIADALSHLINMILITCVWCCWSREERHPELLPRAEFERRYPPGPGSGPAPSPALDLASPTLGLKTMKFVGYTRATAQPLRRTEYPDDE